jgi:hypothetical protein
VRCATADDAVAHGELVYVAVLKVGDAARRRSRLRCPWRSGRASKPASHATRSCDLERVALIASLGHVLRDLALVHDEEREGARAFGDEHIDPSARRHLTIDHVQ